eukprot:CAMPEP_0185573924 /NCGR_PEP_ID=MMETSP0434-20130131/5502_1 /TAXON_ID=626734 ORGANISM="Favella taraikaensis, Strain Fe Narragansett Bay" /NCGR_SAMPLE_ID=MMETSP0434 /ASSEMBLY_ACC=CAM_ASM_000379 /LENGTH=138 /DNA_ID=CAMNT_0028190307 /DNA_START=43 /DNA_END=459 /DNA_ORIENTATION=-
MTILKGANQLSCRLILFEEGSLVLLALALGSRYVVFAALLVAFFLLVSLHVDHTEVEFGDCDPATLNNCTWAPNLRILTQALLCKQSIVFFLKAIGLLSILICFLEQFEEGALTLVRLLQLTLQFLVQGLRSLEVIVK